MDLGLETCSTYMRVSSLVESSFWRHYKKRFSFKKFKRTNILPKKKCGATTLMKISKNNLGEAPKRTGYSI